MLAARGVKEISLIAQDSTVYGTDLYGAPGSSELLGRLDGVDGPRVDPAHVRLSDRGDAGPDGPARVGAAPPPLPRRPRPARIGPGPQADEARIRPAASSSAWSPGSRKRGIAIRTTVIVGFPGETDDDFEQLLDFVQSAEFDRLGAFRYSREEGSGAGALDGQVAEEVKEERFAPPDGGAAGNRVPPRPRQRGDARARSSIDVSRPEGRAGARTHAARRARGRRPGARSDRRRARPATSSRSRSSTPTDTT